MGLRGPTISAIRAKSSKKGPSKLNVAAEALIPELTDAVSAVAPFLIGGGLRDVIKGVKIKESSAANIAAAIKERGARLSGTPEQKRSGSSVGFTDTTPALERQIDILIKQENLDINNPEDRFKIRDRILGTGAPREVFNRLRNTRQI